MEDLTWMLNKGEIRGISNLDRRRVDLWYGNECSKYIILCDSEHEGIGRRDKSAVVDVTLCYHAVECRPEHFDRLQLAVMLEVHGIAPVDVMGKCDTGRST